MISNRGIVSGILVTSFRLSPRLAASTKSRSRVLPPLFFQQLQRLPKTTTTTPKRPRRGNIVLRDTELDDQGRRISRRSGRRNSDHNGDLQEREVGEGSSFGWGEDDEDVDYHNRNDDDDGDRDGDDFAASKTSAGGGWDDFDPMDSSTFAPSRSSSSHRQNRFPSRGPPSRQRGKPVGGYSSANDNRRQRTSSGGGGGSGRGRGRDGDSQRNRRGEQQSKEDERKINMKALEGAGFVHLYGIAPVRNALRADRRDFTRPEDRIDIDLLEGEEYEHEQRQRERKPEAQYSPWLFVQKQSSGRGGGTRTVEKSVQAQQVLELAERRGIPVAEVDKGVLNTLSGNRPHQGMVLRCGRLDFTPLATIPYPGRTTSEGCNNDAAEGVPSNAVQTTTNDASPNLWLVLDEVVDPQNLGALLRSAYFLGGGGMQQQNTVGVLVCAKNSAPPTPTVSAASAGALELSNVYSTSNLPRTLAAAEQDGFRIIGASTTAPRDSADIPVYDLQDLPKSSEPTLLVLGSEGQGLRNLVARSCTSFVRIPSGDVRDGDAEDSGVDSLNVSVTGGILLWHLIHRSI